MHPLVRPRHLTITVLVFLALGGAGIGIAGVQAADEANEVTLVAGFEVPLPNQGDVGRYSLLEEGSYEDRLAERNITTFTEEWLDFRWFDDRMLPTPGGDLVLSNRLRFETGPNHVNGVRSPIMAAGSNDPYAMEWMRTLEADQDEVNIWYELSPWYEVPCFLRNGFQGRTLAVTSQPIALDMDCEAPSTVEPLDHRWRPLAVVEGSDPAIVVFESSYESYFFTARTELWLQDALPYPVRVVEEWERPRDDEPHWGRRVLELEHLDRGASPIATEPVVAELPPIAFARVDELPDESALDMRFTLRSAVLAARDDEVVSDYLAAHPDAFVAKADHSHLRDEQGRDHDTWRIVWTDGDSSLARRVIRTVGPMVVYQPVGPITEIVLPQDADPEITFGDTQIGLEGRLPTPDERPTQMPALADLRAQWAAVTTAHQTVPDADSWGFDMVCHDVCALHTRVGHREYIVTEVDGERHVESAAVEMAWNGTRIDAFTEHRYTSDSEADGEVITPQGLDIQPVTNAAWLPITAGQAAGITFGAFVAALLYWLSPLAKSGIAGFSRIRRDEVLDHPVRRAIYDAIQAEPGIHHRAIMAKTGRGQGTVTHHLHRLTTAGLVSTTQHGRRTCYFVKGAMHHGLQADIVALHAPPARDALAAIQARPGLSSPDLLRDSKVGQSTLHYHLDKLAEQGLVEKRRDGRRMTWWPTERAAQVLAQA